MEDKSKAQPAEEGGIIFRDSLIADIIRSVTVAMEDSKTSGHSLAHRIGAQYETLSRRNWPSLLGFHYLFFEVIYT